VAPLCQISEEAIWLDLVCRADQFSGEAVDEVDAVVVVANKSADIYR